MGAHSWWGTPQHKMSGFYEYGTSPFQLRPFAGFLNPGLFKFVQRCGRWALFIGPPVAFYYNLALWADAKHEYYSRKAYKMSPEGIAAGH
ncbi:cytochrome b-c1 complex subunit 8 [Polychytrium aggregatum]|uniref:cytochrome b-c1 complex subunit 8 n=1 Tax=Polychytrium aggregatum TaxID=110093 RepID=UPI0022FE470A|nr:cytochrome b-c1 complex subunit 8 [Polychytrium aggregatum]KAI9206985.1 cytochrome b-c1 complex subunit 8 [Polychytrium aggregatum]